ncbi:hypothetical protein [Paenibacillus arenosi]|uniref:DUF2975 domain-containing protein n=1 Tax=Paenibacillus arenosi TaxID=2774142 RepID=A0ABR9AXD6_9BACL|nr:hypothetical protein [Paenibacillus arenosi]MBD8497855.1 hypothetical protein [Paenibacillus arenosi]
MYIMRKLISALIATLIFSLTLPMIFFGVNIFTIVSSLFSVDSTGRLLLTMIMFVLGGTYYALGIPLSIIIDLIMRIGSKKARKAPSKTFVMVRLLGYLLLYAMGGVVSAFITLRLFIYGDLNSWEWGYMGWEEIITFIAAAWLFAGIDYLLSKLKLFSPRKHLIDSGNDESVHV